MPSERNWFGKTVYTTILFGIAGVLVLLMCMYLVVFGRALRQPEPHVAIVQALPRVTLSSTAVPVDQRTYLAKGTTAFVQEMERQGFTHIEQMGSAHFFTKDGKRYIADSRMYSSYFMLFSIPTEN